MNLELIASWALVVLAVGGGLWGIIKTLLARDRKAVEDQQAAMWRRLDEVKKELQSALVEQARLKERVDSTPDWETRFQAMESRLEGKFKDIMDQIRELYMQAFNASQRKQG